jgi:hypothetical protein
MSRHGTVILHSTSMQDGLPESVGVPRRATVEMLNKVLTLPS